MGVEEVSGYFTMRIGEVDMCVGGDVPVVLDPGDAAYGSFISEGPSSCACALHIEVTISDPRPPRVARKIWEAGEAWSLYREGGRRVIAGPLRHQAWRADIEDERVKVRCGPAMVRSNGAGVSAVNPIRYPLDQILLMYALAQRRGMILHACGTDFDGRGAIFLGRSGAGKSTIARLLADAGGCRVLSDDRVIVRVANGSAILYGTPWPGDAGMAVNASAPLRACFKLEKSAENRIVDLPAGGVADALLPVASIPWFEPAIAEAVLETCGALAAAVPFRTLRFRKEPEIAALLKEAMA